LEYLYILLGLLLFSFGAEGIVRGSISLAKQFNVSLFAIGIVIVSAGTSLPELANCLKAVSNGFTDLAVGTLIGSNIANIILIMGMTVLVFPILKINKNQLTQTIINILIALILIFLASQSFVFNYYYGIVSILLLILIMFYQVKIGSIDVSDVKDQKTYSVFIAFLLVIIGLIFLIFGSEIFIFSAVSIANSFGVPESVIGASLVAFGTSLPELVVGVYAALRKRVEFALGNILGSNIYNLLGIFGLLTFFEAFKIPNFVASYDIYVMIFVTTYIFLFMFFFKKLNKIYGILSLLAYILYISSLYI